MGRLDEYRKLQAKHLARVERYLARLKSLYSKAVSGLVDLASESKFDGEGQFYFSDYPELKKEVNEVVTNLATGIEQTVLRGTTAEWAQGNTTADGTVEYVFDKAGIDSVGDLTDKAVGRYFNNHESALKAFQKRKIGNGQTLSTKVWGLANHQKVEVELARSIAEGVSAAKIASSMKSLLKEPDKLFRRVRDKNGVLRLSKNAKAYHPGSGTYRSSYRNALRLARTETNMAYRSAEWEGYQEKPYVVGFEIKRSTHPYDCPVCEALAGRYPKDFKWSGWHPNCRCYMVPITFTEEEMDKYGDAFVEGEDFDSTTSVNYVGDVPNGFREWIEGNRERAKGWSSLPYFIKDNQSYVGKFDVDIYSAAEKKFTRAGRVRESMRKALGEYLQERYKDTIPNTELAAIYHYTRGDISAFRSLNKQLHSGSVSDFNVAFSELLSEGISKVSVYDGSAYRSIKLNKKNLKDWLDCAISGGSKTFDGFTSASKVQSVAFGTFEDKIKTKSNETVCHIEILSKNGRDISDISQFNGIFTTENQQEVIFDKGSRFKFVSVDKEDDIYYFTLQEL